MKLLLDQNLSDRIPAQVADLFPGSVQVKAMSLDTASDDQLWRFARERGYVLVWLCTLLK